MAIRFSGVALVLAVACSAPDDAAGSRSLSSEAAEFRGSFVPEPDPPTTGENSLAVTLTDASGTPVVGANLAAEPWMPSMGHGSPVAPSAVEVGGGDYRIEHLSYTMPGKWEVRIDVDAGGVTDQFRVGLDVN